MGIVQRASLHLTIVSYLGVIIGYINKVLLFPNILSTSEVGLANTLVNVGAVFAQFSALGLTGITLRFFPFFRDEKRSHHGFLFWITITAAAGGLLMALVFILFPSELTAAFRENSPMLVQYYYYVIPLGLATLFFQVYDTYLRSLLKTVVPSFLNEVYLRLVITLCISIYAAGWVDFKGFVDIYVLANCSIGLVIIGYALWIGQLRLKPVLSFRIKRLYKGIARFGLFSILSSTGNVLIATIDSLMVAALLANGLHFSGIYTTVFFMTTVMLIPYRSVLKISGPLVAQHWKSGDMRALDKLYKQVTAVNAVLGVFIFTGLWVCLDDIFKFMPEVYAEGKYVFLFISLGRLFDMISGLNGVITITSRKFAYDLFFTLALVALTVFSNYFFIAILGMEMNGAAVATMLTLVVYNAFRLLFVWKVFGMQPFTRSVPVVTVLAGIIILIMACVPVIGGPVVDMLFRAMLVTLLFWPLIIYTKQVKEMNTAINKYLGMAGIRYRVPE